MIGMQFHMNDGCQFYGLDSRISLSSLCVSVLMLTRAGRVETNWFRTAKFAAPPGHMLTSLHSLDSCSHGYRITKYCPILVRLSQIVTTKVWSKSVCAHWV